MPCRHEIQAAMRAWTSDRLRRPIRISIEVPPSDTIISDAGSGTIPTRPVIDDKPLPVLGAPRFTRPAMPSSAEAI